jgi:hypothetical protein
VRKEELWKFKEATIGETIGSTKISHDMIVTVLQCKMNLLTQTSRTSPVCAVILENEQREDNENSTDRMPRRQGEISTITYSEVSLVERFKQKK